MKKTFMNKINSCDVSCEIIQANFFISKNYLNQHINKTEKNKIIYVHQRNQ